MATMRDSDEILLKGLRDTVCADVSAADWDLVLKAVTDAGDVRNVRGMARTILFDAVEKASFASRSEAGRYAANQRWKGHTKGGGRRGLSAAEAEESDLKPYADPKVADARGGLQMQAQAQDPPDGREAAKRRWAEGQARGEKQITSPEEAQIVVETLNTNTATRYAKLRDEGKTHSQAYMQAKSESAKGLLDKKGKVNELAQDQGLKARQAANAAAANAARGAPQMAAAGAPPPPPPPSGGGVSGKVLADKMRGNPSLAVFADKVAQMPKITEQQLEDMVPDYVEGKQLGEVFRRAQGQEAANSRWKVGDKPTIDSKGNASPPFLDTTDIDPKGMSAKRKAELGAKFPKAGMVVDIPSKPRTAEESARIQANFEIARAASKKKKKG